jgi:hypothetical protein
LRHEEGTVIDIQLDLVTADYFDFMEFYNKTQHLGYRKVKGTDES